MAKLTTIMWRLLQSRKVVTYDDLQALSGASRVYVQEWMSVLIKREVVRKLSKGRYQLVCDDVFINGSKHSSKSRKKTERLKFQKRPKGIIARKATVLPETKLWQAIIKLEKFFLKDLIKMDLANKTTTYQYVAALVRAGFLSKDKQKRVSNQRVYTLLHVPGDIAPVIGRALYLYAPNTNKIWDYVPIGLDIKKHLNTQ
jgi:hypothetical protein